MPVQIRIDFFRVVMPDGCTSTFEDALRSLDALPRNEKRTFDVNGAPVRLQEITFGPDIVEGDLVRIRMNALPPQASRGGEVKSLNLKDDEGLGEETAFVYVPSLEVLALQRNRIGVSAPTLTGYLMEAAITAAAVRFDPILERDAYARLSRMKEVRRVDVRIAAVKNVRAVRVARPDTSVASMLDMLQYFQAPTVEVTLTMGHQPGSLFQKAIDNLYKCISSWGEEADAQKMVVSGVVDRNGVDERDEFDLLRYRMVEAAMVDESGKRRLKYSARRTQLRKAVERRREVLNALFGQKP